jgi:phage gpG-like protein
VADKETRLGAVTFSWRGQAIENAVRDGVWTGLVRAGVVLQGSMQKTVGVLGHPRSRRSLPGEPPRVETNRLRKSISTVPSRSEKVVRVGTNVPHGRYMEFGTKDILPRPWVERSKIDAHPKMVKAFHEAIRQAIRRAAK